MTREGKWSGRDPLVIRDDAFGFVMIVIRDVGFAFVMTLCFRDRRRVGTEEFFVPRKSHLLAPAVRCGMPEIGHEFWGLFIPVSPLSGVERWRSGVLEYCFLTKTNIPSLQVSITPPARFPAFPIPLRYVSPPGGISASLRVLRR